jgi:hypothetical protein
MGTQVKNTHLGYYIGTAPAQKVGFFGATPIVQPAGASEAAVAQTSAANATTNAIDLGTAEALANACKTQGNALVVDVAALIAEVNALRTALVNLGLVKGGA